MKAAPKKWRGAKMAHKPPAEAEDGTALRQVSTLPHREPTVVLNTSFF